MKPSSPPSSGSSDEDLRLEPVPDTVGGYPETRVLIIATGGTICMKRGVNGYVPEANFINLLLPRPQFNDGSCPPPLPCHHDPNDALAVNWLPSLRTPLSAYNRYVRYSVLEFNPLLDSSSINAKGWGDIARTIERNYQLFDAFVVLHGTDSLSYTASALGFMINSLGKAIILTGSQAPMTELQSDATDNLLGSLIIAGHFMIPEVCLYFNFKLFRGNRTTKSNAVSFNAFTSPNHSPLATVGINISINWDLITRPSSISPFSISPYQPGTSHVACLRIFPGILPAMVEGVLQLDGLRGLVLETFGSGNAPEDSRLLEVLRKGVEDGIVVVNVTQCMTGSVSPLYATGTALARTGVVFGLDMTTEAALTKLSCLLADPNLSVGQIRKLMSKNLRGEVTEATLTSFSHPPPMRQTYVQQTLAPKQAALSALGYAIQQGDEAGVMDCLKQAKAEGSGWLLNEFDYAGCTPLHIAAMSPSTAILRNFLSQGASVHLRNQDGHTPLYLAADKGMEENVKLLRESGAHLHAEELDEAVLHRRRLEAGSGNVTPAEREVDHPAIQVNGHTVSEDIASSRLSVSSLKDSMEARRWKKVRCWELAGAAEGPVA